MSWLKVLASSVLEKTVDFPLSWLKVFATFVDFPLSWLKVFATLVDILSSFRVVLGSTKSMDPTALTVPEGRFLEIFESSGFGEVADP